MASTVSPSHVFAPGDVIRPRHKWRTLLMGLAAAGAAVVVPRVVVALWHAARDPGGPMHAQVPLWVVVVLHAAVLGLMGAVAGHLLDQAAEARHALTLMVREDPLTGLSNRRVLDEVMHDESQRRGRRAEPLSVLMLDVDHFKRINDVHGHAVGDLVLRGVAGVLRQECRRVDTAARFGGEEFVVVLPGLGAVDACLVAERIRAAVEAATTLSGHVPVKATLSVGVASLGTGDATGPSGEILEHADHALFRAKRTGRNRVCLWERDAPPAARGA